MTSYLVCRTCGRHLPAENAVNRAFCSEACTHAYAVCMNCGRFFPRGKGFDGEHCTRECAVRYQLLRKYGPEPVTVVAEV